MIPGDKAVYPGTTVLVNKFNIKDAEAAHAIEYKFASVRELELAVSPIEGKFDFDHLQAIHKHVFQDMYDWAGEVRTVDFAKRNRTTGYVNRFVPGIVMDLKVEDFNKFIADHNQLKEMTKPEFVKAITEVHTMINELHPFREGNGRSTRIFLAHLAREAGFELNLEHVDKDRWNLASHTAQVQHHPREPGVRREPDKSEMHKIFAESLEPTMAHAFAHEARPDAVRVYPALKQAYARLDAISEHAQKSLPASAATRVIETEKARISERLQAADEQARKTGTLDKLHDEKTRLGGGRTSQPDGYEVVASVLVDVLKQKGLSPAAIEKTMADANRRLNEMRDAGVPAPGFKGAEKAPGRTPGREPPNKTAEPKQEKGGPSYER